MTDPRIAVYEAYVSAWSALPDDERLRLLRGSLTEEITFSNATKPRAGIADIADHLAGFQAKTPGGSFRLVEMLAFDDHAMATWQFVDAAGKAGFIGYDALVFGADRKIKSIVMFSKVGREIIE